MKILYLSLVIGLNLSGCSSLNNDVNVNTLENNNIAILSDDTALESSISFQQQFKSQLKPSTISAYLKTDSMKAQKHSINQYIQAISQDLIGNLPSIDIKSAMAVSTFIYTNEDSNSKNILSTQITESFIHEIHQFGIPIIDISDTDESLMLRANDTDISLLDELSLPENNRLLKYIVSGTLTNYQDGILVNARIIDLSNKTILSTAQGFLPPDINNYLPKVNSTNNIKLVSP
jgi:TolB-like protein